MDKLNLNITYINPEELTPYENNVKEHPNEQIKQIMESIREFGFNDPIGVYGPDNIIIEGHGRHIAALNMKLKEVPIIRLDHLNDEQRRAYIIAHNKLTMNSGFDIETLLSELESLDGDMQDLTGFNDEEISELFDSLDSIKIKSNKENDKIHICPSCGYEWSN